MELKSGETTLLRKSLRTRLKATRTSEFFFLYQRFNNCYSIYKCRRQNVWTHCSLYLSSSQNSNSLLWYVVCGMWYVVCGRATSDP